MNLQFTAADQNLYGTKLVVPENAVVTVNGTLRGVSGQKGSTIEADGTIDCTNGLLSLAGKAVVLNMEGIHMEVAQRIIDFTCGATYSMDGNLQKISNYIFIATPSSVELSGDFPELLADGSMNVSGMNLHF